jgi:hypothetical protein
VTLSAAVRPAREVFAETMTEDELLTAIIEAAHARGWLAYHVRNSKRGVMQGDPGFPDVVLAREHTVLFWELKSERGKQTKAQSDWWWALPNYWLVRPSGLDEAIRRLR